MNTSNINSIRREIQSFARPKKGAYGPIVSSTLSINLALRVLERLSEAALPAPECCDGVILKYGKVHLEIGDDGEMMLFNGPTSDQSFLPAQVEDAVVALRVALGFT